FRESGVTLLCRCFCYFFFNDVLPPRCSALSLHDALPIFPAPPGADPDAFQREVVRRVQEAGTCWLGGTTFRGRAALRISVSSWATTPDDVERSADAILRCARAAAAAVQGRALYRRGPRPARPRRRTS